MTSEDLLSEIQALVEAGVVRDERGIERTLRGCHKELLADATNCREYDLFFDLSSRELRVLPWTAHGALVLLPLGGQAPELDGQTALEECIDKLRQHLMIPEVCRRLHPEFLEEVCAATEGNLKRPGP